MHNKRTSKLITFEIIASATLAVFLLFFASVFEFRWTGPFDAAPRLLAHASGQQSLEAKRLSDTVMPVRGEQPRNFFHLAALDPVSLSNESYRSAPALTAVSAVVIDRASGIVLFEKQQHKRWPIASITKLVTASILLDYRDKYAGDLLPVEIQAEDVEGGRNFFEPGDQVRWEDLFKTMLAGSSNTAARALIRSTGMTESEWQKAINQKLLFWGLQKTQIREVTGLSPGDISTAYEIGQIFDRSLERQEIRDALSAGIFTVYTVNTGKAVTVESTNLFLLGKITNPFLKPPVAKTGYIDESGFNMVARVTGDQGQELIVTVLGTATHFERFTEVTQLAQWAFSAYSWQ